MNTATAFWDQQYVAFVDAVCAQEARDLAELARCGVYDPAAPLPPEPTEEAA